jgi:flagellar biosynthesis/type III secretory pathway protein FliH
MSELNDLARGLGALQPLKKGTTIMSHTEDNLLSANLEGYAEGLALGKAIGHEAGFEDGYLAGRRAQEEVRASLAYLAETK